jgi:hypothetical protein
MSAFSFIRREEVVGLAINTFTLAGITVVTVETELHAIVADGCAS